MPVVSQEFILSSSIKEGMKMENIVLMGPEYCSVKQQPRRIVLKPYPTSAHIIVFDADTTETLFYIESGCIRNRQKARPPNRINSYTSNNINIFKASSFISHEDSRFSIHLCDAEDKIIGTLRQQAQCLKKSDQQTQKQGQSTVIEVVVPSNCLFKSNKTNTGTSSTKFESENKNNDSNNCNNHCHSSQHDYGKSHSIMRISKQKRTFQRLKLETRLKDPITGEKHHLVFKFHNNNLEEGGLYLGEPKKNGKLLASFMVIDESKVNPFGQKLLYVTIEPSLDMTIVFFFLISVKQMGIDLLL